MEGRSLSNALDLTRSQADAHLNAPNLADLGDTLALGALRRGKDDLLGALDLVVVKEPGSGALNEVDIVGLGDDLEKLCDSGLSRGLLGSCLGLLLVSTLGQKTGRDHQSDEELVGIVISQDQVGIATSDGLASLVLGLGDDSVADDGTEAIDLSTELDLDGLALLDLDTSLGLVGAKGSVGSDVGRGGDSGRVREAWRSVS